MVVRFAKRIERPREKKNTRMIKMQTKPFFVATEYYIKRCNNQKYAVFIFSFGSGVFGSSVQQFRRLQRPYATIIFINPVQELYCTLNPLIIIKSLAGNEWNKPTPKNGYSAEAYFYFLDDIATRFFLLPGPIRAPWKIKK